MKTCNGCQYSTRLTLSKGVFSCPACGTRLSYKLIDSKLEDEKKVVDYTPNHIPVKDRTRKIAFSVFLLIYGGYGVYIDDLYIPGNRRNGIHLHEVSAWVMYCAFICGCLAMLSTVVDHYDKRDNEIKYRNFSKNLTISGLCFYMFSLVLFLLEFVSKN